MTTYYTYESRNDCPQISTETGVSLIVENVVSETKFKLLTLTACINNILPYNTLID